MVDLNAERERRNSPDAAFIYVDEKGVQWFKFTCEFECDDSKWGFEIWALDHQDAMRRVEALKASASVKGKLYHEIPFN